MIGKLKRKWCAYRRDPKSFVLFLSVCLAALDYNACAYFYYCIHIDKKDSKFNAGFI